jgi:hypothetical protein
MVAEVFVNCYNFHPVTYVKIGNFQGTLPYLINLSGAGAGAVIRIGGSVEP